MLLLGDHGHTWYKSFSMIPSLEGNFAHAFTDRGKEVQSLKAIAVVMIGAIFATTVRSHYQYIDFNRLLTPAN